MRYSDRNGANPENGNTVDRDKHERLTVEVLNLAGEVVEVIERAVYIDPAGHRAVRYKKGVHRLRDRGTHKDCIVVGEQTPKRGWVQTSTTK